MRNIPAPFLLFGIAIFGFLAFLNFNARLWTAEFVGADIVQGPVDHSLLCDPVDTDESQDDEFGGWRVGGKEVVQAGQHTDQHKPIVAQPSEADVAATITTLQRQLAALGFYKGKIDSIAGPQTNAALIAWENDG